MEGELAFELNLEEQRIEEQGGGQRVLPDVQDILSSSSFEKPSERDEGLG